ncbi:P-loop containing nucleoside triphosphate hydrolase protein [Xylaria telfairii]|nr:P-loop containing nucleoside triphosphate hydrolase protein [Xylaria telfairii]
MDASASHQTGNAGEKETSSPDSTPGLVSNWYRHECKFASCPSRWSEFKHVDDDYAALVARVASVPIIHRFTSDKQGKWSTTSITVQDVLMRKFLKEALKDYQDLDLHVEDYTFKTPFMPLCHRWENLKHVQQKAKEPALKHAASQFLDFLTPIVASSVASIAHTRETGKIAFNDIWQIFAPNTLVSTKFYGVQTTCCVTEYVKIPPTPRTPPSWKISMKFTDWNGESAGFSSTSMTISDYEGYRRVSSLPVFPISFLEDEASYKASMIDRGKIFEKLRGYHFMKADGVKISVESDTPIRRPITGKVCIDAYAYYTSCNIVKPDLKPFSPAEDIQDTSTPSSDWSGDDGASDTSSEAEAPGDSRFTAIKVEEDAAVKGPMKRVENLEPLTDDQRLLATPWVKGFDLKSKQWCELRVDELQPMTWNDEAFDKLVLPGDEKHLAWEFVEAKSLAQSENFDDFIADKGRGLIILMFGPPGVGKTFTAEAVADKSRVPLYAMSAAELGTAPDAVEKALERALGLCRMWNAMLLLDEADVFLGARTPDSIARNELVAIFLRMLEYYQGTMFLTTNRIASIDPAFQSRIDLFLPYYDLSTEARREVWRNFIERAGQDKFDVTDESLGKLSELPLNGREIKNLIKSAQLLSLKSGSKVSMERVYMLAERRVQALAQASEGN